MDLFRLIESSIKLWVLNIKARLPLVTELHFNLGPKTLHRRLKSRLSQGLLIFTMMYLTANIGNSVITHNP